LKILIAYLIITMVISIPIANAIEFSQQNDIERNIEEIYVRLLELYKRGIDVSPLINELNNISLNLYMGSINHSIALEELNRISLQVKMLESAPNYLVILTTVKYVVISIVLSIPIAIYYLLPRIYVLLWYKYRRRWIVR